MNLSLNLEILIVLTQMTVVLNLYSINSDIKIENIEAFLRLL